MKAQKVLGGITFEVEGDPKEIFTQLAAVQDVFGAAATGCGGCGCPDVYPVVREYDGNTYYEMRCTQCRCKLSFGQKRDGGGLFIRRKNKDGDWLPNNGWEDWKATQQASESFSSF
jgi:hypothetical protein